MKKQLSRAAAWVLFRLPLVGPRLQEAAFQGFAADMDAAGVMLMVTCRCGETHQFDAGRAMREPEVYEAALSAWNVAHRACVAEKTLETKGGN